MFLLRGKPFLCAFGLCLLSIVRNKHWNDNMVFAFWPKIDRISTALSGAAMSSNWDECRMPDIIALSLFLFHFCVTRFQFFSAVSAYNGISFFPRLLLFNDPSAWWRHRQHERTKSTEMQNNATVNINRLQALCRMNEWMTKKRSAKNGKKNASNPNGKQKHRDALQRNEFATQEKEATAKWENIFENKFRVTAPTSMTISAFCLLFVCLSMCADFCIFGWVQRWHERNFNYSREKSVAKTDAWKVQTHWLHWIEKAAKKIVDIFWNGQTTLRSVFVHAQWREFCQSFFLFAQSSGRRLENLISLSFNCF